MDVRTHIVMAKRIYDNLDPEKQSIIKKKNFIYGNIKPDMVSKYKLKKHYRKESYGIIVNKIERLAKINSLNDLKNKKYFCNFSQELGVICHFTCDFFCVPHDERWEFKNKMAIHLAYEKRLNLTAKTYSFNGNVKIDISNGESVEDFLNSIYIQYKNDKSLNTYKRDLEYAYKICYIIVSSILDEILSDDK